MNEKSADRNICLSAHHLYSWCGKRMSAASLVPSSSSHDLFSSSTIAALARLLLVRGTHIAMRERSDMS